MSKFATLVLLLLVVLCDSLVHSQTIRLRAGSSVGFTDRNGLVWGADEGFNTGTASSFSFRNIAQASDSNIYLFERSKCGTLTYNFTVPNREYTVNLHFAELNFNSANARVFDVFIVGGASYINMDIFSQAGGKDRALFRQSLLSVTTGQIVINIVSKTACSKISAIEIIPVECNIKNCDSCMYNTKCDICKSGWSGTKCEDLNAICFGIDASNATVCSGNGRCTAKDYCECSDGFKGEECRNRDCTLDNSCSPHQIPMSNAWNSLSLTVTSGQAQSFSPMFNLITYDRTDPDIMYLTYTSSISIVSIPYNGGNAYCTYGTNYGYCSVVMKMNVTSNQLVWYRIVKNMNANSITTQSDGVVLGGTLGYYGTSFAATSFARNYDQELFIAKFSKNGDEVWGRAGTCSTVSYDNNCRISFVKVTSRSDDRLMLTGSKHSTWSWSLGTLSVRNSKLVFIFQLNREGVPETLNDIYFGPTNVGYIWNHVAFGNRSTIIVGQGANTVYFDSTNSMVTSSIIGFVVKYTNGKMDWYKVVTGAVVNGIAVDNDAFYVSGNFDVSASFDGVFSYTVDKQICSNCIDAFVAKYDLLGNVKYVKRILSGAAYSVAIVNKHLLVAGYLIPRPSFYFDDKLTQYTRAGGYIAQFSLDGQIADAKIFNQFTSTSYSYEYVMDISYNKITGVLAFRMGGYTRVGTISPAPGFVLAIVNLSKVGYSSTDYSLDVQKIDTDFEYKPLQGYVTGLVNFEKLSGEMSGICFNWVESSFKAKIKLLKGIYIKWSNESEDTIGEVDVKEDCFNFDEGERISKWATLGTSTNVVGGSIGQIAFSTTHGRSYGNLDSSYGIGVQKFYFIGNMPTPTSLPRCVTPKYPLLEISSKCSYEEEFQIINFRKYVYLYSPAARGYISPDGFLGTTIVNYTSPLQLFEAEYYQGSTIFKSAATGNYLVLGTTYLQQTSLQNVTDSNRFQISSASKYCFKKMNDKLYRTASSLDGHSTNCFENEQFVFLAIGTNLAVHNAATGKYIATSSGDSTTTLTYISASALFTLDVYNKKEVLKSNVGTYLLVDSNNLMKHKFNIECDSEIYMLHLVSSEITVASMYAKEGFNLKGIYGNELNGDIQSLGLIVEASASNDDSEVDSDYQRTTLSGYYEGRTNFEVVNEDKVQQMCFFWGKTTDENFGTRNTLKGLKLKWANNPLSALVGSVVSKASCFNFNNNEKLINLVVNSERQYGVKGHISEISLQTDQGRSYHYGSSNSSVQVNNICIRRRFFLEESFKYIATNTDGTYTEVASCSFTDIISMGHVDEKVFLYVSNGLYLKPEIDGTVSLSNLLTSDALFDQETIVENIVFKTVHSTYLLFNGTIFSHKKLSSATAGDLVVLELQINVCLSHSDKLIRLNGNSYMSLKQNWCDPDDRFTLISYGPGYLLRNSRSQYLTILPDFSFGTTILVTIASVFTLDQDKSAPFIRFNDRILYFSNPRLVAQYVSLVDPTLAVSVIPATNSLSSDFSIMNSNGIDLYGFSGYEVNNVIVSLSAITKAPVVDSTRVVKETFQYLTEEGFREPSANRFDMKSEAGLKQVCFKWNVTGYHEGNTLVGFNYTTHKEERVVVGREDAYGEYQCFNFEQDEKLLSWKVQGSIIRTSGAVGYVSFLTSQGRSFESGDFLNPTYSSEECLMTYGIDSSRKLRFVSVASSSSFGVSNVCKDKERFVLEYFEQGVAIKSTYYNWYISANDDGTLSPAESITDTALFQTVSISGQITFRSVFNMYLSLQGTKFIQKYRINDKSDLLMIQPDRLYCWKNLDSELYFSRPSGYTTQKNSCFNDEYVHIFPVEGQYVIAVLRDNNYFFVSTKDNGEVTVDSVSIDATTKLTLETYENRTIARSLKGFVVAPSGSLFRHTTDEVVAPYYHLQVAPLPPPFTSSTFYSYNRLANYELNTLDGVNLLGLHGHINEEGVIGTLGPIILKPTEPSNYTFDLPAGDRLLNHNFLVDTETIQSVCCYADSNQLTGLKIVQEESEELIGFESGEGKCITVKDKIVRVVTSTTASNMVGSLKIYSDDSEIECVASDPGMVYTSYEPRSLRGFYGHTSGEGIRKLGAVWSTTEPRYFYGEIAGEKAPLTFTETASMNQVARLCVSSVTTEGIQIYYYNTSGVYTYGGGSFSGSNCFNFQYGELITYMKIKSRVSGSTLVGRITFMTTLGRYFDNGDTNSATYFSNGVAVPSESEYYFPTGKLLVGFRGSVSGVLRNLGPIFKDCAPGYKSKVTFSLPAGNTYVPANFRVIDETIDEICCTADSNSVKQIYFRGNKGTFMMGQSIVSGGTLNCLELRGRPINRWTATPISSQKLGALRVEVGTEVLSCSASNAGFLTPIVMTGPRKLIGIYGHVNGDIRSMGAIWNNNIKSVALVKYTLSTSTTSLITKPPKAVAVQELINESSVSQTLAVSGEYVSAQTSSIETSVALSQTTETSLSVNQNLLMEVGVEIELDLLLFKAKVKIAAEVNLDIEVVNTKSESFETAWTSGRSHTSQELFSYYTPMVVAPRTRSTCNVLLYEVYQSVPWQGIVQYTYEDDSTAFGYMTGIFNSLNYRYVLASVDESIPLPPSS